MLGTISPCRLAISPPSFNIRIDVTDPGPTKPTWCSSLLWFMTISMSVANFFHIVDVSPIFVISFLRGIRDSSFRDVVGKNGG